MLIRKFSEDLPDLNIIEKGDWIDLYSNRACKCSNIKARIEIALGDKVDGFEDGSISYKKGQVVIVGLGMAMELDSGCEAEIRPRSGTFKKYGLLLTNSIGTIDEAYCGNEDEWQVVFYATRDGRIGKFDRLVQFKQAKKMEKPNIEYVSELKNKNRDGFGSTGK